MGLTNLLRMPMILGRWCNRALTTATTSNLQQQQQRFNSTRMNCSQLTPKCGDRFKKKPCDPKQQKVILPQPLAEPLPPQKRSIKLKHPQECCGDPCPDAYPRFDVLYYRRTDKLNREYQQTWAECPKLIKKPKVICCFDQIKYPKWEKRPRKLRPQTACRPACLTDSTKCSRLVLPGCRRVRIPPVCNHTRRKTKCKKPKAPFPSFSECSRKQPKPRHPIECSCHLRPSICETWAHYYKMSRVRKIKVC